MSDQSTSAFTPGLPIKMVDNGDGTYSPSVSTSVNLGDVTIDNSGVESRLGATDETAAASDTATSGLNGLIKRALAHLSTLIGRTPVLGPAAAAASVPVVDSNGQGNVLYTTNTTAVTGGSFRQVVCLTETVFSTFTRTGATGSITGVTLPAGTVLFGPVTAYTLTSGAVAAYD